MWPIPSGSKLRGALCTRKEKEAEKERLRQEKAAQKAEKEAQWERRRLEKEVEMGSARFFGQGSCQDKMCQE